jgi:hypothetical protein
VEVVAKHRFPAVWLVTHSLIFDLLNYYIPTETQGSLVKEGSVFTIFMWMRDGYSSHHS